MAMDLYNESMNVSLTPELEDLVRDKVASGRYLSASEVIREALRLFEEQDKYRSNKLQKLINDVNQGLESGTSQALDISATKANARKRLSKNK